MTIFETTLRTLSALLAARWDRSESGAAMVEYGLLVALIAVVAAAAVKVLGGAIYTLFNNVATTLQNAVP